MRDNPKKTQKPIANTVVQDERKRNAPVEN